MERLKTRSQFQAVLAGRIVARTPHFALHQLDLTAKSAATDPASGAMSLLGPPSTSAWVGALVPKRWAKRAATRNAIRRQIYQNSLLQGSVFTGVAFVVRLRAAFERARFKSASSDALKQAVQDELILLMGRLAPPGAGGRS